MVMPQMRLRGLSALLLRRPMGKMAALAVFPTMGHEQPSQQHLRPKPVKSRIGGRTGCLFWKPDMVGHWSISPVRWIYAAALGLRPSILACPLFPRQDIARISIWNGRHSALRKQLPQSFANTQKPRRWQILKSNTGRDEAIRCLISQSPHGQHFRASQRRQTTKDKSVFSFDLPDKDDRKKT